MATFAAKYLVSSATSGVTSRVGDLGGDIGKQFNTENISKKDLDRAEKDLDKQEKERKKKHYKMEVSREKIRNDVREKYRIKKRRGHEPIETHSGILLPKSEKELLLEDNKEEEEECSPCMSWVRSCFPCFFNDS